MARRCARACWTRGRRHTNTRCVGGARCNIVFECLRSGNGLHAKSMFVYDQIVRQPPSFRAGGCQENTTTERSDSMPKSSLRILTSAPGTLNWFEEHAQEKLKTGTAVSLAHAQQLVAEDYQSGDWSAIVQFSKECGVLLDNNTICFERGLRADRETAWRWLVTRELLAKWHIPTEMEFRVGGRFEFKDAWSGVIGEITPGLSIR